MHHTTTKKPPTKYPLVKVCSSIWLSEVSHHTKWCIEVFKTVSLLPRKTRAKEYEKTHSHATRVGLNVVVHLKWDDSFIRSHLVSLPWSWKASNAWVQCLCVCTDNMDICILCHYILLWPIHFCASFVPLYFAIFRFAFRPTKNLRAALSVRLACHRIYCVIINDFLSRWYFIEFEIRLSRSHWLCMSVADQRKISLICRNFAIIQKYFIISLGFHWILYMGRKYFFALKHFQLLFGSLFVHRFLCYVVFSMSWN